MFEMIAFMFMMVGLPIAGLVVAWLVFRMERRADVRLSRIRNREICARCNQPLPPGAAGTCPTCRTVIRPPACRYCACDLGGVEGAHCPGCGKPLREVACPRCRYPLGASGGEHCPECGLRVAAVSCPGQSDETPSVTNELQPSDVRCSADG